MLGHGDWRLQGSRGRQGNKRNVHAFPLLGLARQFGWQQNDNIIAIFPLLLDLERFVWKDLCLTCFNFCYAQTHPFFGWPLDQLRLTMQAPKPQHAEWQAQKGSLSHQERHGNKPLALTLWQAKGKWHFLRRCPDDKGRFGLLPLVVSSIPRSTGVARSHE